MSDGGISAGDGAPTNAPASDTPSETPGAPGLTEDQAREVIASVVDERISAQLGGDGGLDRLYARMGDVGERAANQAQHWSGRYEDEQLDDGEEDPDFLDVFDQALTSAVDRRLDVAEQDQDAELAVAARDLDYEDLREQYPALQDQDSEQHVLGRAIELIDSWGRIDLVHSPAFVDVIEQVVLASYADPAIIAPARGQAQNGNVPAQNSNPGLYGHVQLEPGAGGGGVRARAAQQQGPEEYWSDRVLAAAHRLRPGI